MEFQRICIIGIGLVGGSLAAAAKQVHPDVHIFGIDKNVDSLDFAMKRGYVDAYATPCDVRIREWLSCDQDSLETCDLVVLATPASCADEWFALLGDLEFEGIVTDVASTKRKVLQAAEQHLKFPGRFVGGHPMAGSEISGVMAARSDLFRGAYYVLTPTSETNTDSYRKLHKFFTSLGARVISVDAAEHDEAVAIISHVPHMTASALVNLAKSHAGQGDELLRLAAGGFKDSTRIAAGSPELWTGICLDNADAIVTAIDQLREVLDEFAHKVRRRDSQAILAWLTHAADIRRGLPSQWVVPMEQLTEVIIPMVDRPGVISEVTAAVWRAGCNIEAIEIDHISEDSALLILALTEEGDIDRLLADLEVRGYSPSARSIESASEA